MVDILQNFTSISEKPGKFILMAERNLPKILAASMIFYVLVSIEYSLNLYDYDFFEFLNGPDFSRSVLISYILMMAAATIILVRKNLSNTMVISIYLIALSVTRILTHYSYLFSVNTLYFSYGILVCTVAVNMFLTGMFFFKGIARNRDSVLACSLLMVFIYIILLSFYLRYSSDKIQTLRGNLALISQIILYLLLFITLDTHNVHINSDMGRVDVTVRSLRTRTGAGEKTAISEAEMRTIANGFGNMVGWSHVNDGGPVEFEYRVIISMRDSNAEMLLQKWKGSDKISFTISDNLSGSLVYAKRFLACRYVYDSEGDYVKSVRFIDEDGNILRFHVISTEEVEKMHEEVEDDI